MLDEKDLQAIKEMMGQLKTEISSEMDMKFAQQKKEIITETSSEMDIKFAQQKKEIITEISSEMDVKFAQQKKEIIAETTHNMNILIETKVQTQLNVLAEGHEAIIEKLVPRSRFDDLEEEVRFLKSVMRQLSEDVHTLKHAN